MSTDDKRWQQRFNNFVKAFQKLQEAVLKAEEYLKNNSKKEKTDNFLENIIKEGLIQRFEYTHELAWNVMKDFFKEAGNINIFGSKDATREAFATGLISNGEVWMDMIISRNKTSHTYNEDTAEEIFFKIVQQYYSEFLQFKKRMEELSDIHKKDLQ
ncbi:nucleotidyltransferase substrate binding protein [Raineya orbicola]|jgi:nucleotidyltransferase substrate binding protein (TIGR01987 family)|uniref:Nucleotidyltransferase substrate binding protein n=1 Tax=Raineya orbicola TaxID=2016530 RepID=A0A2N3II20_9BACT|nr:nucleotidyltransferase substrate binding protein [Raineya orbicola]PKQ69873.1 Nucleotidyltransferase substrate binding protein [Raineya orbicola]